MLRWALNKIRGRGRGPVRVQKEWERMEKIPYEFRHLLFELLFSFCITHFTTLHSIYLTVLHW